MTQRYATVDADGRVVGFYADDVNPVIPEGAVEISEDAYAEWLTNSDTRCWKDGALVGCAAPAPAVITTRTITPREFRNRFTAEEKSAITLAASKGLEAGDATLQVFLDDLAAAGAVDLDDPDLLAGVHTLLVAGLITEARAKAVLA
ncbi:hypothetical protein [Roseomonas elaeocarpi]|uniref:Uncharacterized protein n=1 Tax=Roseomonas elaeocarpi TaxID=907779 RepID=A0ABV6JQ97_9PROT